MDGAIKDLTFYQKQLQEEQNVYSWLVSLKNEENPFNNIELEVLRLEKAIVNDKKLLSIDEERRLYKAYKLAQ